jgi:tetratricopeptide (TPR) repeat protein
VLVTQLIEKAGGPRDPRLFTYWSDIAGVYRDRGEAWRGDTLFDKQRQLCASVPDKIPYCRVDPDLHLRRAEFYAIRGDITRAIPEYKQVIATIEERTPLINNDRLRRNIYVMALGDVQGMYAAEGDFSNAIAIARKNVRFHQSEVGPESSDVGYLLYRLADLEALSGNKEAADEDYSRAVALLERNLGQNRESAP